MATCFSVVQSSGPSHISLRHKVTTPYISAAQCYGGFPLQQNHLCFSVARNYDSALHESTELRFCFSLWLKVTPSRLPEVQSYLCVSAVQSYYHLFLFGIGLRFLASLQNKVKAGCFSVALSYRPMHRVTVSCFSVAQN